MESKTPHMCEPPRASCETPEVVGVGCEASSFAVAAPEATPELPAELSATRQEAGELADWRTEPGEAPDWPAGLHVVLYVADAVTDYVQRCAIMDYETVSGAARVPGGDDALRAAAPAGLASGRGKGKSNAGGKSTRAALGKKPVLTVTAPSCDGSRDVGIAPEFLSERFPFSQALCGGDGQETVVLPSLGLLPEAATGAGADR